MKGGKRTVFKRDEKDERVEIVVDSCIIKLDGSLSLSKENNVKE